jgi:hypothetical protein
MRCWKGIVHTLAAVHELEDSQWVVFTVLLLAAVDSASLCFERLA